MPLAGHGRAPGRPPGAYSHDLTEGSVADLPGIITLSERTLAFLADVLQAHRERLRIWRELPARDQALLVLAHLRNGDTYARLAAGFDVGVATAHRYVREAVDLLADLTRSLTAALWVLAWTHSNFALLDGTRWCTPTGSAPTTGGTTPASTTTASTSKG